MDVSIHAPWEGCDLSLSAVSPAFNEFQFTHPGKGATILSALSCWTSIKFQFTHPGKGATILEDAVQATVKVSIHAPWEGCDSHSPKPTLSLIMFQFTHPGKGATASPSATP